MEPAKIIAIVANSTWNIYNFRLNVIRKCIENGYKVYVLAPIDAYIEYKENYPEVTHINLRALDRDSTNPIKDLLLIEELRRKYKRIKPDLIIHYTHKPNIFGTMASAINGYKSISVITGLGYSFINRGIINVITENLYKFVSKYNELMVFENTDDKEMFVEKNLISREKTVSVKGCGVDTVYYKAQDNEVEGPLVFTFIGRLLKDKGIQEFAGAASWFKKQGKDARFLVLGDFDPENPSTIDRDELLSWISEDIIDYKGFVNDVRPIIAQSSCIVLPSYREGMPRIILEAMSMGKPVITTLTAGCRETVVDDKNGFLVQTKDTKDLIRAMEEFTGLSETERKAMGNEGHKLAETQFSDTIIAEEIFSIISSVVK
ncbi:MAG: glycosyltransferase family 4 protein [Saprospiraceae bacterium]|nr:glycosyltransferase family 4 protein [Saprospiraceae bacterium]